MVSVVGMQFGDLIVLEEGSKSSKNGWLISTVKVQCECGNTRWLRKTEVITGVYRNCKRGVHGKNVRDLRNQTFGYWTVLRYAGSGRWECKCECGKIRTIRSSALRNEESKSCGCKRYELMAEGNTLPNNQSQKNRVYRTYEKHAKTRNLIFQLSKGEFEKIISGNCFYCNVSPTNMIVDKGTIFRYNGVDRIDSTEGYTTQNCVPCCKICNVSKSDLTLSEWKSWITRLYLHQQNYEKSTTKHG